MGCCVREDSSLSRLSCSTEWSNDRRIDRKLHGSKERYWRGMLQKEKDDFMAVKSWGGGSTQIGQRARQVFPVGVVCHTLIIKVQELLTLTRKRDLSMLLAWARCTCVERVRGMARNPCNGWGKHIKQHDTSAESRKATCTCQEKMANLHKEMLRSTKPSGWLS